jgi:hypothetical protein
MLPEVKKASSPSKGQSRASSLYAEKKPPDWEVLCYLAIALHFTCFVPYRLPTGNGSP